MPTDDRVRPVDLAALTVRVRCAATSLAGIGGADTAAAGQLLTSLVPHLPDLHSLAYEPTVGERVGGSSTPDGYGHTSTGDRRAKIALANLDMSVLELTVAIRDDRSLRGPLIEVGRSVIACRNLYAGGPGADERLRGTMLGDAHGHHAKVEHQQLLRNQRARAERGEYTPARAEQQPEVPGLSRSAIKKAKKVKRKGKR